MSSPLGISRKRAKKTRRPRPDTERYIAPGRAKANEERYAACYAAGYAAQSESRVNPSGRIRGMWRPRGSRRMKQAATSGFNQSVIDQFVARGQKARAASGD